MIALSSRSSWQINIPSTSSMSSISTSYGSSTGAPRRITTSRRSQSSAKPVRRRSTTLFIRSPSTGTLIWSLRSSSYLRRFVFGSPAEMEVIEHKWQLLIGVVARIRPSLQIRLCRQMPATKCITAIDLAPYNCVCALFNTLHYVRFSDARTSATSDSLHLFLACRGGNADGLFTCV